MAGITSIEVKESRNELVQQLQQVETPTDKERLQVLYWLKQEKPPSIGAIAKAIGKHRNTVDRWLWKYREGGVRGVLAGVQPGTTATSPSVDAGQPNLAQPTGQRDAEPNLTLDFPMFYGCSLCCAGWR